MSTIDILPDMTPILSQSIAAQHRTVLYVEDNLANMALLEQIIGRRKELKILKAFNARNGIQMAKEFRPDAIVMDINLPDMNGIEALKILLADTVTSSIPVMALSSNAYPRQIEKGIAAGFCAYLTKPYNIDEFMSALDAMLQLATNKLSIVN